MVYSHDTVAQTWVRELGGNAPSARETPGMADDSMEARAVQSHDRKRCRSFWEGANVYVMILGGPSGQRDKTG
jgi:hypothetical protein